MSGILARIKALFEPSRPASPPGEVRQEVEETSAQAAAVPETAETAPLEPIVAIPEPPPAEAVPAAVAQAPAVEAEAPTVIAEAKVAIAESPDLIEEAAPTLLEEAPPTLIQEAPPEVQAAPQATLAGGLTLRLENERGPRSTFEVTKSGATIGRGPESTIQLPDLSVSRKHAKITYKQGAYWLSDLGSMGGTWIDGAKLAAPRRVTTGQTIDIGLCRLTVTSAGEDEESPAAKAPSRAASSR